MKLFFSILTIIIIAIFSFSASPVCAEGNETGAALTAAQKAIIPIAAFTANGDTQGLIHALNQGLDAGLTLNEIKEILVQMYAYAGFPRSLSSIKTFMDVLQERKDRGINDKLGEAPKPLPQNTDRLDLGTKMQTEITGHIVSGPVYDFAPEMNTFLREHLFCDIFSRGLLTNQERELATVSALAALPAPAQLAAHLRICLHNGLTPAQMREYVAVLAEQVGQPQGELAARLLEGALGKQIQ